MRQGRLVWFLIGVLVGGAVSGPGVLVAAFELRAAHPGLTTRIESEVPVLGAQDESTPTGNLGDVQVTVSVHAQGRTISPYIYGVAAAPANALQTLGATSDRWGGDNTTRYNWVLGDTSNAARDWYFQNVGQVSTPNSGRRLVHRRGASGWRRAADHDPGDGLGGQRQHRGPLGRRPGAGRRASHPRRGARSPATTRRRTRH